MADGTSRFSKEGQPFYHNPGAFSQYTVVPDVFLVKLRNDVLFEKAALVSCGVITGVGGRSSTGPRWKQERQ